MLGILFSRTVNMGGALLASLIKALLRGVSIAGLVAIQVRQFYACPIFNTCVPAAFTSKAGTNAIITLFLCRLFLAIIITVIMVVTALLERKPRVVRNDRIERPTPTPFLKAKLIKEAYRIATHVGVCV